MSKKKLSKLLGAINHLDGIDPETRSKLYLSLIHI